MSTRGCCFVVSCYLSFFHSFGSYFEVGDNFYKKSDQIPIEQGFALVLMPWSLCLNESEDYTHQSTIACVAFAFQKRIVVIARSCWNFMQLLFFMTKLSFLGLIISSLVWN